MNLVVGFTITASAFLAVLFVLDYCERRKSRR